MKGCNESQQRHHLLYVLPVLVKISPIQSGPATESTGTNAHTEGCESLTRMRVDVWLKRRTNG